MPGTAGNALRLLSGVDGVSPAVGAARLGKRGTAGELEAPQRLRLTFTYQNLSREAVIALPSPVQGLPIF